MGSVRVVNDDKVRFGVSLTACLRIGASMTGRAGLRGIVNDEMDWYEMEWSVNDEMEWFVLYGVVGDDRDSR